MEHIISKDGTPIFCESGGEGPPLILVHGTGIDRTYWEPVRTKLERCFTVTVMDRRGRGESGETLPYSIQREFEDVAAVVDHLGGPVNVLGHSYGALCSLEASLLTDRIRRMVLYEPPIYAHIDIPYPPDAPDKYYSYLEEGRNEEAVMMVYELADAPPEVVELLRSQPNWRSRLLSAPTMPREFFSARGYKLDPRRFESMMVPTLLMLGEDSTPFYKAATEAVHACLPNNLISLLPGQRHEAVITAPELVVQLVLDFLAQGLEQQQVSPGRQADEHRQLLSMAYHFTP